MDVEYHCKPLGDTDWNGSGMHCNFSTTYMREIGGKAYFEALMAAFEKNREDHIAVYGPDNHMRLTGKHETWRRRSRRVDPRPAQLRAERLQRLSRGPAAELAGDPYQIASQVLKTIASVPTAKVASLPERGLRGTVIPRVAWAVLTRPRHPIGLSHTGAWDHLARRSPPDLLFYDRDGHAGVPSRRIDKPLKPAGS